MKYIVLAVKLLISAALIGYLLTKAYSQNQFAVLFSSQTRWSWFAIALVLVIIAHVVNYVRWWAITRDLDLRMRFWDAQQIGFITQFFGLAAFGIVGSDAMRAFYAMRDNPGKKASAVASVFFDRLIGLLTMMACAGSGYWVTDWEAFSQSADPRLIRGLQSTCWLLWWVATLGFAALFGGTLIPKIWLMGIYDRTLKLKWIGGMLSRVIKVLMIFRGRTATILVAIGCSLLINLLFVLAIDCCGRFAGGNKPALQEHIVVASISLIANCLPLPGGIGGMEAALDLQYQALSPGTLLGTGGQSLGVIVALAFRATLMGIALIGAMTWLSMSAVDRHRLKDAAAP